MAEDLKKLPAIFYRSLSGAEPVREWLKELDQADRRIDRSQNHRARTLTAVQCRLGHGLAGGRVPHSHPDRRATNIFGSPGLRGGAQRQRTDLLPPPRREGNFVRRWSLSAAAVRSDAQLVAYPYVDKREFRAEEKPCDFV